MLNTCSALRSHHGGCFQISWANQATMISEVAALPPPEEGYGLCFPLTSCVSVWSQLPLLLDFWIKSLNQFSATLPNMGSNWLTQRSFGRPFCFVWEIIFEISPLRLIKQRSPLIPLEQASHCLGFAWTDSRKALAAAWLLKQTQAVWDNHFAKGASGGGNSASMLSACSDAQISLSGTKSKAVQCPRCLCGFPALWNAHCAILWVHCYPSFSRMCPFTCPLLSKHNLLLSLAKHSVVACLILTKATAWEHRAVFPVVN